MIAAAESGGVDNGGGGGDGDDGEGEKGVTTKSVKKEKKNDINITGMGSRYIEGDVSTMAIVVNAILALASLVAVVYLIFTAPNKDSPQFAMSRDGPEYDRVKLGIVEEAKEEAQGMA